MYKLKYLLLLIASSAILISSQWVSIDNENQNEENIRVENSDIFSTKITLNINGYEIISVNGESENIIRLKEGAQILEKGAPDLPMKSTSIIIPDDKRMEVRVLNTEYIDFPDYNIIPSKGNISRLINPETIPYEYGKVYTEDNFYPNKLVELRDPYILRELRGTSIVYYPIQYNPVTNTLRVYSEITVEVYTSGEAILNELDRENTPITRSMEFQNIYSSHFINSTNDLRFEYLVDHGNMLIISNEAFMTTMNPLIEWKNLKGIPVEMVSVSQAGGNSTAIKNFVSDYYYTHGLTFLLLVGDIAQVPSPSINGSLSDPSYGFIAGDDSYAEVIVGRFSGSAPSQIETQVERSINYERFPNNGDWYTKALGIASNQGPGWGGQTDDVFNSQTICPILTDYNYDDCPVIADPSGSLTQGVNAINQGRSIINYTGHGYQLGWSNGAPLGNSDVNGLTNTGMLPFVITVGCNVGEFDAYDESFGEAWLRATHNGSPSGGIAHMGSTISQSWEPPMHGQYGMNLILTESYDENKTRTIGGIATNGCLYMNDLQGSSGINETNYWTYFGDPTVNIRTLPPSELSVNHESILLIGQSELTINTSNEGDLVAISRNGELIVSGYTNTSGNLTLDISSLTTSPGDVDLVISSYNKYPYESILSIITPEGPFLMYHSYEVVDDTNGNGNVDFNEEVTLNIFFENIGVEIYEGSVGTYGPTNFEYITSNIPYIVLDEINAGEIGNTTISFTVSGNVPDGYMAEFWYDIGGGYEGTFQVLINAPILELSNPIIFDENADGVWEAGEYANIQITYSNNGSADYFNYPGLTLESLSEYVTIDNTSDTFYGVFAGQSETYQFFAEASENTPLATVAQFIFTFGSSEINGCEENLTECPLEAVFHFNSTIGLEFNDTLNEPLNLITTSYGNSILVNWEEPTSCPEGQFSDCEGICQDNFYLDSWLGDGVCDDGSWGIYFNCSQFNCDEGDCDCEDNTGTDDGGDPGMYCGDGNCDQLDDYYEDSYLCPEDCDEPITNSCENNCGGNAGDCWCDDSCLELEDCCLDYEELCAELTASSTGRQFEFFHTPDGERSMDLFNISIGNHQLREFIGYNLYRNGLFVTFTTNTQYEDFDIIGGTEYCYDVLAVYDEGISNLSNSDCSSIEMQLLMGDMNNDGSVNVTDIILEINIITSVIEATEYHWAVGDMNNDSSINVLDIVNIVNIILGSNSLFIEAEIDGRVEIINNNKLIIENNRGLSGFQFNYNGDFSKTEEVDNWNITFKNGVAIGYTMDRSVSNIIINISEIEIQNEILLSDHFGNGAKLIAKNIPSNFGINSIYPNPFNPKTTISYDITKTSHVNIVVFDLLGNQVISLVNEVKNSGNHNINFNGSELSSGLYFVKMNVNNKVYMEKLMLMK